VPLHFATGEIQARETSAIDGLLNAKHLLNFDQPDHLFKCRSLSRRVLQTSARFLLQSAAQGICAIRAAQIGLFML